MLIKANNLGEFKRAGSHMNFPMSICICLPSVYNTVNLGRKIQWIAKHGSSRPPPYDNEDDDCYNHASILDPLVSAVSPLNQS